MPEYHIQGLGACMLVGFPHRQEDSFFDLALAQLRADSPSQITTSCYSMGGFPITRVPRHLNARCLKTNPSIVVIQFASCDLIVPLRKNRSSGSSPRKVSCEPPNLINRLIWQVQGLVGDGLQLEPITPPAVYLATMAQITQQLLDHGVTPVVISPFVFGGRRSDRIAEECHAKLHESGELHPTEYVDAYSALAQHPRHQTLLADGTHLSLTGHRIVAGVLFTKLKSLVNRLSDEARARGNSLWMVFPVDDYFSNVAALVGIV